MCAAHSLEYCQIYLNIFLVFVKSHFKTTLFHSRKCVLLSGWLKPCATSTSGLQTQKKIIDLFVFFWYTVCASSISFTLADAHGHTHLDRTPRPHLSGPSLLSAQPNSIRHSFWLSPWCSSAAGRNWTKRPPNSKCLDRFHPLFTDYYWLVFFAFYKELWRVIIVIFACEADDPTKSHFCHRFVKSFGNNDLKAAIFTCTVDIINIIILFKLK